MNLTTKVVALLIMLWIAAVAASHPFAALIFTLIYIFAGRMIYLRTRVLVAQVEQFLNEGGDK